MPLPLSLQQYFSSDSTRTLEDLERDLSKDDIRSILMDTTPAEVEIYEDLDGIVTFSYRGSLPLDSEEESSAYHGLLEALVSQKNHVAKSVGNLYGRNSVRNVDVDQVDALRKYV